MAYFDEAADKMDKENYYRSVDPGQEEEFTVQLSDLLRSTHTSRLPYNPSLFLYPLVDRQESGKLFSIYSGKEFDLAELLMMDAKAEVKRLGAIVQEQQLLGRSLTVDEVADLEAKHPYNCEHVVPRSWFGKHNPMNGDLHHLFTCEETCNRFRNNFKYADFRDYPEVLKDACGKLEDNRFEPERNKGIVARAVLYFLVRYPTVIDEYNHDDINMLINWHLAEKVTLFERHRNQVIFRLQGNRNPLIDFPEWANLIEFEGRRPVLEKFFGHTDGDQSPPGEFTTTDTLAGCLENPKPWQNKPWRVAKALLALKEQVNLLAPHRNRNFDGDIGDGIHEQRNSDHNPQIFDPKTKQGIVTALDITHDPREKCNCETLAESLRKNRDTRIKYIIWNRRILNSSPIGNTPAWQWRSYSGGNAHDKHIHISVKCDQTHYDAETQWDISTHP